MPKKKTAIRASIALAGAGLVQSAWSDFDQWQISEIFSNSDGTIQFIELSTTAANQGDLSGQGITSANTEATSQNSASFASNLSGDTSNRSVLVATQGFVDLTGLTPDLVVETPFLFTEGGTIDFGNGVSTLTYTAAQLPKNGVQAISGSLQPKDPDPTNFAGLSANPGTSTPALFDGISVLTLPILDVPGIGVANVSFDVNLNTVQFILRDDFYLYGAGITAGDTPATLQGVTLHIPLLPIGAENYAFDLSLVGDNPITFANLANIVATPASTPEPEPEPEPDPTQQSIERGQALYTSVQCNTCHGPTGGGGIGPSLRGHGASSFAFLRSTINGTMPQGNANACVDSASSTCATDIANFIIDEFGSGL